MLSLPAAGPDAQHPPTLALTLDPRSRMLTCVYGDHSIYVWDVHDLGNVGKIYSARYHSGCVWNLEVSDRSNLITASNLIIVGYHIAINLITMNQFTQINQSNLYFF